MFTKKDWLIGFVVVLAVLAISAVYNTYFPEQVLVRFHEY
jgi:hypothetical protein